MKREWRLVRHSPVLAAAGVLFLILSAACILHGGDWTAAWSTLKVPALSPSFADTRTITHSLDAVRHGHDPYTEGLFDPWGRHFNYPRAWLALAATGLGAAQTNDIGIGLAVLVTISLAILFECRSLTTAAITVLIVVSPPVLLLVERGNCDALIFSTFVLAFMLTGGQKAYVRLPVRGAVIVLLTVLKVYPVISGISLITRRRSAPLAIAIMALAVGALYWTLLPEGMALVSSRTPQEIETSYGSFPLVHFIMRHFARVDPTNVRLVGLGLALGVAAACAAIVYFWSRTLAPWLLRLEAGRARDDVAVACLSIYAFSFALGSNYDYRLIFLIGAVPPMLAAYDRERRLRDLALPGAIALFLWAGWAATGFIPVDELIDWGLFAAACAILASTFAERLGILPDRSLETAGASA